MAQKVFSRLSMGLFPRWLWYWHLLSLAFISSAVQLRNRNHLVWEGIVYVCYTFLTIVCFTCFFMTLLLLLDLIFCDLFLPFIGQHLHILPLLLFFQELYALGLLGMLECGYLSVQMFVSPVLLGVLLGRLCRYLAAVILYLMT